MIPILTNSDIKTLLGLLLCLIFLIVGLRITPNNGTLSNKYSRLDYMGSFICVFFVEMAHILKILGISDIQRLVGILSLWDFIFFLFLSICFFWSGSINIHFRKEINDDTSYKFGLSFFAGGWIIIFYLLAEFFRY